QVLGPSLGEDRTPFLGIRAVEANDDRISNADLIQRGQKSARDLVAAGDPAEDVEEDRANLRVCADYLERVDNALRVAATPEVAEVRWTAAGQRDHVQRGHDEPCPVAQDPH